MVKRVTISCVREVRRDQNARWRIMATVFRTPERFWIDNGRIEPMQTREEYQGRSAVLPDLEVLRGLFDDEK